MSPTKAVRWMSRRVTDTLGGALGLPALMLASSVAAGACSDSDEPAGDAGGGDGAVLLVERVSTPQGQRFYYASLLPEVPTGPVDRSQALELTSADVEVYDGHVFIRDRTANKITRYTVSSDRKLVQDGVVSLANTGLGEVRVSNAYVSPELAYALDSDGWRLIGWNPTTMTLTGDIVSINNMAKPLPGAISAPVKVGDRIIAAILWQGTAVDPDTNIAQPVIYGGSGAIIIDASGAPSFVEDSRLGGAFRVAAGDDGDAFVAGVIGGDVHLFGKVLDAKPEPASGVLRLPAGATGFDPDYFVDIEAITHTVGVSAIHRLDEHSLLAQIYDPSAAPPASSSAYFSSKDFVFGLVTTDGTPAFTPLAGVPKGGRANAGNHVVDGKLYIQIDGGTGAEAFAVTAEGAAPAFSVPSGDIWFLQRMR